MLQFKLTEKHYFPKKCMKETRNTLKKSDRKILKNESECRERKNVKYMERG